MNLKKFSVYMVICLGLCGNSMATVLTEPPATPDQNGRYLFLMFGLHTEILGPDSFSPFYQKRYETTALSRVFPIMATRLFLKFVKETRMKRTTAKKSPIKLPK